MSNPFVQEARILLADLPAAIEARGEFEFDDESGPILVVQPFGVLTSPASDEGPARGWIVGQVWPKGELTEVPAEERSPGVPLILKVTCDAEGFMLPTVEPLFEGKEFESIFHAFQQYAVEAGLYVEAEGDACEDEDPDFEGTWGKPGFLARLRNAWDALRGLRPWGR